MLWLIGERGRLMLPSTRAALRESLRGGDGSGTKGGLSAVHAYIYGRWTRPYIWALTHLIPHLSEEGRRWWTDRYHGKVLTPELAEAVVTLDHDILEHDCEQIVPYPFARDIILNAHPQIVAYECACRLSKPEHCEPTQVCMIVGSGEFVLDHHPDQSRKLTQDEALEMLRAEHERGHVHIAWFKDACGDRFYAICNCCKCCCGGIESMVKHGSAAIVSSGFVAQVDPELCAGCGTCADVCPFDAVTMDGTAVIAWEQCMGCGACVDQCTTGALSLERDERKGVPMDVRVLGEVG